MAIFFTPCSASFSAIPRPIPRDAPVIRAVCWVSVIGMTPSRSRVRTDRIDLVYYVPHLPVGKRVRERPARHPFYTRLNQRPAEHHFDDFIEGQCHHSTRPCPTLKLFAHPRSCDWSGEMQLAEKRGGQHWGELR